MDCMQLWPCGGLGLLPGLTAATAAPGGPSGAAPDGGAGGGFYRTCCGCGQVARDPAARQCPLAAILAPEGCWWTPHCSVFSRGMWEWVGETVGVGAPSPGMPDLPHEEALSPGVLRLVGVCFYL